MVVTFLNSFALACDATPYFPSAFKLYPIHLRYFCHLVTWTPLLPRLMVFVGNAPLYVTYFVVVGADGVGVEVVEEPINLYPSLMKYKSKYALCPQPYAVYMNTTHRACVHQNLYNRANSRHSYTSNQRKLHNDH